MMYDVLYRNYGIWDGKSDLTEEHLNQVFSRDLIWETYHVIDNSVVINVKYSNIRYDK